MVSPELPAGTAEEHLLGGSFSMTTNRDRRSQIIAAHHEAGHAVGSCYLGIPIQSLSIAGEGSGDGRYVNPMTFKEIRDLVCWEEVIVIGLLGPLVEGHMFHKFNRNKCFDAFWNIKRILITFLPNDPSRRRTVRVKCKRWAKDILNSPGFLDAVKGIAQELLRYKQLNGEQVKGIVRKTLPSVKS